MADATIAVLGLHPFYELSCLASLIAFTMRNQLVLRCILLFGYSLQITGNVIDPRGLSGESVLWNGVFLLVNLCVVIDLLYGRTTFRLSAREKELFALMGDLSPGEFRKLVRAMSWRTTTVAVTLTTEGATPDRLHFVYWGAITILKSGRETPLAPPAFIGEIAFLKGGGASATVWVEAGSHWVEWPVASLRSQLEREPGLRTVVTRLIGEDLAQKVARA